MDINPDDIIKEFGVRRMEDGYEAWVKSDFVKVLGLIMVDLFKMNGAENYVELSLETDEFGPLVMTLQRLEGKTPHQFRMEAEDKYNELLKNVGLDKSEGRVLPNDMDNKDA